MHLGPINHFGYPILFLHSCTFCTAMITFSRQKVGADGCVMNSFAQNIFNFLLNYITVIFYLFLFAILSLFSEIFLLFSYVEVVWTLTHFYWFLSRVSADSRKRRLDAERGDIGKKFTFYLFVKLFFPIGILIFLADEAIFGMNTYCPEQSNFKRYPSN